MNRVDIRFSDTEHRQLKQWARRHGISVAEAVRRCVARQLEKEAEDSSWEERVRLALAACGRHRERADVRTVGRDYDRHLAVIYRRIPSDLD